MELELKELAVGVGLGILTLLMFRAANIHRERGTYAVLLAAITMPYVMMAVETHEPDFIRHCLIALGFTAVAMAGARWNLWLVVAGLIAHAAFDGVLHYTPLLAPTPGWYGPLCLGYDLVLATGLAGFLVQGKKLSDMT